jgi:5'-deoxynucleotidase YfbR-like HD superfamily hydrolase
MNRPSPKPTTDQILALVDRLILPFHQIIRQHKLPVGERRLENDVEHSWSVAVLACALAPAVDTQLDLGKISQFALVHDLVEIHAGDTKNFTASAEDKATKADREAAALHRLQSDFAAFPWLAATIAEYETMDSSEAQFVYAVDKYITVIYDLLDHGRFLAEIGVDKARYDSTLSAQRIKAQRHPEVGKYYNEIRDLIDRQPDFLQP